MRADYLVIYQGEPEDPEEFLRYYREEHLPIVRAWPGVVGVELAVGADGEDPHPTIGGVFMVARFSFESIEALRAALRSEERQAARADRGNFPAFEGTVRHQAVLIEEPEA